MFLTTKNPKAIVEQLTTPKFFGGFGDFGREIHAEEAQGTQGGNIPRGTRARAAPTQLTHCFGTQ